MTTDAGEQTSNNRIGKQPVFVAIVAALFSTGVLFFAGQWFGSWGFLVSALVVMLGIEQIRRVSRLTSLIRVGAAVGLLLGWLLHRYI